MQVCSASEQLAGEAYAQLSGNEQDGHEIVHAAGLRGGRFFSSDRRAGRWRRDDCKDNVTAEGKPASLRDLGAYPNSLLAWRSAVKDKYGSEYNSWRYAKDADVACIREGRAVGLHAQGQAVQGCPASRARQRGARRVKKDCKKDDLQLLRRQEERRQSGDQARRSTGWEIDARKKYGKEWAVWDNASETDIDCHKVDRRHPVHRRRARLARSKHGLSHRKTKAAAEISAAASILEHAARIELDDVDLGRHIGSDLEANFLLANCRLCSKPS